MNGIAFLVLGIVLSMLAIPVAIRIAPRVGMVDLPDPRKVHARPVPRVGGIGITAGALIPVAVFLPWTPLLQAFLIGAMLLFVFGAWDDAKQISHWIKFVGQFVAASLVVYYGDLWVERFPFMGATLLPEEIGKPFTVFAMVGVINAINHSDGLDGLAGGESLLGLIVMGFLSYAANDAFGVFICCAVAGGILGFLRFNTHPAQIFMGDAGSQFLGFSMGFLAVYLTQVAHTALSPALPLLLIGLPIADINAVFYLRISGGMNWFKATRNHIHHRLLDLGLEHYETVITIYLIQAMLVGSAVVLRYQSDFVVAGFYFLVVGALFAGLTYCERHHVSVQVPAERRALGRVLGQLGERGRLARAVGTLEIVLFSTLLISGPLSVNVADPAIIWIAGGLFLLTVVSVLSKSRSIGSLSFRFCASTLALLVVYLGIEDPPQELWRAMLISTPVYVALGIILAAAIRLASESVFKTTATDYLILFGLIMIAIFGQEVFGARQISTLIVHSAIMVYASEYACRAARNEAWVLSIAVLAGYAVLLLKGLMY